MEAETSGGNTEAIPDRHDVRVNYLQAEDLALRAIQAEYDVPVSRQMRIPGGIEFDGFFVKNGTAHIIEVKFARRRYLNVLFEQQLDRIVRRLSKLGWYNFMVLIIVVVFGDESIYLAAEATRLSDVAKRSATNVEVRCFSLSELAAKFGFNAPSDT